MKFVAMHPGCDIVFLLQAAPFLGEEAESARQRNLPVQGA